jgi:hypothetical protein
MVEELGGFDGTSWFYVFARMAVTALAGWESTNRMDLAMQVVSYGKPLTTCIARIGIARIGIQSALGTG